MTKDIKAQELELTQEQLQQEQLPANKACYSINIQEAEDERIKQFRAREKRERQRFSYKHTTEQQENTTVVKLDTVFDDQNMTEHQKGEILRSTICAITGASGEAYGRLQLSQAIAAIFPSGYDHSVISNAVTEGLLSMNPSDPIEAQLCTKILVLNNQANTYLARAADPSKTSAEIDLCVNRAVKLMRVHNETIEALNRYRRKEQKITVTHQNINVSNGGQAVVAGQMSQNTPGEQKK